MFPTSVIQRLHARMNSGFFKKMVPKRFVPSPFTKFPQTPKQQSRHSEELLASGVIVMPKD